MRTHKIPGGRQRGFSLLEVLIAVVVLAMGLLAMASLQAKLSVSSAEAKARSRIASLMTSTVDYERAQGYGTIAPLLTTDPNPVTTTFQCVTASPTAIQSAICSAQADAGVSGITLSQTVTRYYAGPSSGSFTTTAPAASVKIYGDYKVIKLTASWTDAAGNARTLVSNTITSNLDLSAGSNILAQNITTSANLNPVVHELNPGNTAGVIPIAVGTGDNTYAASTNPKPTVSSSGANSTTFSTLNYSQGVNDTTATSTIQQRVETEVAECVCQGATSNPFASDSLLGQYTFRPTYWDGTRYVAPAIVTGGVPKSSAAPSINQSSECDICCRDHSDVGIAATDVRYDAVTGDTNRYKVAKSGSTITTPIALATSGSPAAPVVADITRDAYLDSCRMIRVDGLWRVATDIQASHVGLIATNDLQGVSTSPITPYSANETKYQSFVVNAIKSYLASALPSAGSPDWVTFLSQTLAGLYTTAQPDVPTITPPLASTDGTYRYLHAHGLYVDYLEAPALNKLNAIVSSSCQTSSTNYPKCVLPYLPFSTINISGLAAWTDTNDTTDQAGTTPLGKTALSVGNGTSTSSTCTSSTFFGGCVTGLASGYAYATATIGHSNSGIAGSIPVNPYELLSTHKLTAAQQFNVSNTNSSDSMYAQVYGPNLQPSGFSSSQQFPTTTLNSNINPTLTVATGSRGASACSPNSAKKATTPNPYSCNTTVALSAPTTITVSRYNQVVAQATVTAKDPCNVGGSSKNKTYPVPGLICYTLSTATLSTDSAGSARIDCNANPKPAACYNISSPFVVSNTKTAGETTAVTISSATGSPAALSNSYLNLTYVANGSAIGTVDTSTCATTQVPTITAPTSCP